MKDEIWVISIVFHLFPLISIDFYGFCEDFG